MKSWHLDRRTFLLGSGVSMALPYMEAMGEQAQAGDLPARMCAMYFPFGISSVSYTHLTLPTNREV